MKTLDTEAVLKTINELNAMGAIKAAAPLTDLLARFTQVLIDAEKVLIPTYPHNYLVEVTAKPKDPRGLPVSKVDRILKRMIEEYEAQSAPTLKTKPE